MFVDCRQVDEVVTSTAFLAQKIVETQFRLLLPTFGHECVLETTRANSEQVKATLKQIDCENLVLLRVAGESQ